MREGSPRICERPLAAADPSSGLSRHCAQARPWALPPQAADTIGDGSQRWGWANSGLDGCDGLWSDQRAL